MRPMIFAGSVVALIATSFLSSPLAAEKGNVPATGLEQALATAKKEKKLVAVVVYQFG